MSRFSLFLFLFALISCDRVVSKESDLDSINNPQVTVITNDEEVNVKRIYSIDFFKNKDVIKFDEFKLNESILKNFSEYKSSEYQIEIGHYEDGGIDFYVDDKHGNTLNIFRILKNNGKLNLFFYEFLDINILKNKDALFFSTSFISEYINVDRDFIIKSANDYSRYLLGDVRFSKKIISKNYENENEIIIFFTDPLDDFKTIFFIRRK